MRITSMQIKKKLALLLASTLLVTSINVMPVEASADNQATGSENENAVASTDLSLSIAALNANQGNTTQNATGSTNLSLEIASVPATGQTHDEEWKNLNTAVTPDSNSGTYQITESGKYYLSADINHENSNAAVIIKSGVTATICLDGHTISSTGTAISVPSGASLTIEDCSEPESKTGRGTVTSSCDNSTIEAKGYLEVKRVNVTNTNNSGNAINAEGSDVSDDSVVIKNSKLSGRYNSLRTGEKKNITIESTECTGRVYTSGNTNMTVSDSTIISDNSAIDYNFGNNSEVNITNSVLTTTSPAGYNAGLMCWFSQGPIKINIEGSTINAPENGIRVDHVENLKITNSKIICTNTGTQEWGYAISYGVVDVDSGNKLEVSDVEIRDWNTGISICSDDNSNNPEMDLTLSGDVKF